MPVSAVPAISTARNGVGAFILQCKQIDLHYCDWGGSSRGMKAFLSSKMFPRFASAHPQIQLSVSPRPNHHPLLRARYINGRDKAVCVRNLEAEQILCKLELLRNTSGEKARRVKGGRAVTSMNESVRGVWDPFHAPAVPKAGDQSETGGESKTLVRGRDLLGAMAGRANRQLLGQKKVRPGRRRGRS